MKAKEKFAQAQARFICKHALGIVITVAIVTALLFPFAKKLPIHANFLDLLPPSHPSILKLKELMSHVGGTSYLVAVVESADEKTAQRANELLIEKAGRLEQIEYVDNRTNIPTFETRKLLFLKLDSVGKLKKDIQGVFDYYRRLNSPFSLGLVEEKAPQIDLGSLELEEKVSKIGGVSAKQKDTYLCVMLLKPKHPVVDFAQTTELLKGLSAVFAEIQKEVDHPVTLELTGAYKTRYDEYRTITHDVQSTGVIALVLMVLLNLIAFRNVRSLIYAYLPLVIGIIWVSAFTQMTIGYLNLITSFMAAILFGMGGDYTFHILTSFEEDVRLSGKTEEAIQMTYSELWHPLWSSMWTTAVVFYSMTFSNFQGFRHFGIIAGVGIVISFVVVLYLQPSLIILIERYFPKKRKPLHSWNMPKWGVYVILILGLIYTVFSSVQVPRVKFNYDFTALQAKNEDSMRVAEKIGKYMGVQLNPVVYMTPDRGTATRLAQEINASIDKNPDTMFDFAAALTSHVARDQNEKIKILGEIDAMIGQREALIARLKPEMKKKIEFLRAQLKAEPYGIEDLPAGLRGQYEGTDGKISTVFVYPKKRILDGRVAKVFVAEARNFPVPPGVTLAGEPIIYSDILHLLEKDTPIAILLSIFTVFILVFRHFKRLDHVLWVHAPFVVGILWMMGMMGASGLGYNFLNMAIIPSILGVGIDNGIYIFDRYKERKNENFFQTMSCALKGVVLSSGTNIVAFASLAFATHVGIASIGKLGVFGFLSCLLASVFFIPALIEFYELKYAHLFRKDGEA